MTTATRATALGTETGSAAASTTVRHSHAARWWVLVVLGTAQLMVVLDVTVVNIALPAAQSALNFSDASRQWVVTGYSLAFGSLLLLGGRLSDRFDRRNTFVVGLAGFAVTSAIGGASTSFGMLVVARVGQGVFAAVLAPAALSLLVVTFTDPAERAKAIGIFGALSGAGGAVGLLLGGALTEWASWRWALLINLAFATVALVGALLLLARQPVDQRPKLDLPGTVTVTAALFSIVFGFANAESHSWSDAPTIGFLVAGVVLLAGFVAVQARVAHPLLPLRIVLDRIRGGAYLAAGFVGVCLFSIFLFLTYYLQLVLGYSPIMTGVAFLPLVAGLTLSSTATPSLVSPRVGARAVMTIGFLLAAIGLATLTRIGVHTGYFTHVLPGLIVIGLGFGAVVSSSFQGATSRVATMDTGVASAMVGTAHQIGGSIGTAVMSTIAATALAGYLTGNTASPELAQQATVSGYATVFGCAAGLCLLGARATSILNTAPAGAEGKSLAG